MKNLKNWAIVGLAFLGTSCASYNHLSNSTIEEAETLENFQGKLGNKYIKYESEGRIHKMEIFGNDSINKTYIDTNGDFEIDRIEVSYPNRHNSNLSTAPQKEFNKTLKEILKSRKK